MRRRTTANSFDDVAMSEKVKQFERNWANISIMMENLIHCSPEKTKAEREERTTADKQEHAQEMQYADGKLTEDDQKKIEFFQALNSELTLTWDQEEEP